MNKQLCFTSLQLSAEQLQNYALAQIKTKLQSNGSTLRIFSEMSFPDDLMVMENQNKLVMDEMSFDREQLPEEFSQLYSGLDVEHNKFYHQIIMLTQSQEVKEVSSSYMVKEEQEKHTFGEIVLPVVSNDMHYLFTQARP